MAKIYIELSKSKASLQQWVELEQALTTLSRETESVRSGLRHKIAGQEAISARMREAVEQLTKESGSAGNMRSALEEIIRRYEQTEKGNTGRVGVEAVQIMGNGVTGNRGGPQDTRTFDDDPNNGTYGADQGDMAHNRTGFKFLWFRLFEDEELFDFVKSRSRYRNYTDDQIAELMEQINAEGCGYVAIVNNIFTEYEGREDEFERIFGFPMYDKKGNPNYNYLLVDFYASTDDQYYLDETKGATSLVNDVILSYLDGREGEFRDKYGCDPLLEGGYINPEARQAILDEYQGSSTATLKTGGTTPYSLENRLNHYLNEKGVDYSAECVHGELNGAQIDQYMSEGKNINISVDQFNLYDENGNAVYTDVGGHWMTVTGVTDDGRYIVSSWGKRYYLNPSELSGSDFLITDMS